MGQVGSLLSVVVPTFNEKDNIRELVRRLDHVLQGEAWEVVFVDDDSPDGTADVVRELAQERANVRCIHRVGRRGLSRAVVEGILSTSSPYVAVMDADLQHDESILPKMLESVRSGGVDIVVGSRYCEGGSVGEWDSRRAAMSRFATTLARLIVKVELTDPMSGFFMVKRQAFASAMRNLSGEGYKILLDIFSSAPAPLKFAEVPFTFRQRLAGESKLDTAVLWEYLMLIVDKTIGKYVPARFILFSLVGLSGLFVHFLVLWLAHQQAGLGFVVAQATATGIAMTSNFAINNLLTYRDSRLRGRRFLTGLLSFYVVCSVGALANVGVANFVFGQKYTWWLAGFAGVVVGTVWNYAASSIFTWNRRK